MNKIDNFLTWNAAMDEVENKEYHANNIEELEEIVKDGVKVSFMDGKNYADWVEENGDQFLLYGSKNFYELYDWLEGNRFLDI